jgi:hypothetical protein
MNAPDQRASVAILETLVEAVPRPTTTWDTTDSCRNITALRKTRSIGFTKVPSC